MPKESLSQTIDWERLLREFENFEAYDESCHAACDTFTRSLIHPVPEFVEKLIQKKIQKEKLSYEESVKALYCFLLQKRYNEKLNLLHFAFHIFDENTCLPDEVINQTPFPHEEGLPSFKHFNDPSYKIEC
ncbi:hypothetical protein [Desulforhabdus amnigena]|jgi:hypothetical protein|uniref:Uncharacterized protein n=1 Tax=Desulforhabdus amnigena TaxID=40218 RepID=A0A9W6FTU7_9BACT|nr:hypothetical protein [Desulforhabdus amnigena]NLJ27775.1 hypothetical protein [Deltaproteobacteria bacterium]GLI34206.1 hypothetical protein DAMNIGENAA_16390 [Desulforhabdus amnigena]